MSSDISIGLDASTKSTGYAVFKGNELIDYGLIKSNDSAWRERLVSQSKELSKLFDKYNPVKVYVEDVPLFPRGGVKTAVMLGAVQGMIYVLCAVRNIVPTFVLPSVWRSPLGLFDGSRKGTGRDILKRKSVEKANELFGLKLKYITASSTKNEDDISDAILLCYSQIKERYFGK